MIKLQNKPPRIECEWLWSAGRKRKVQNNNGPVPLRWAYRVSRCLPASIRLIVTKQFGFRSVSLLGRRHRSQKNLCCSKSFDFGFLFHACGGQNAHTQTRVAPGRDEQFGTVIFAPWLNTTSPWYVQKVHRAKSPRVRYPKGQKSSSKL